MDLVGDDPPLRLDDPAWPLLTGSLIGVRRGARAKTVGCLLSPGVIVEGGVLARTSRGMRGCAESVREPRSRQQAAGAVTPA